MSFFIKREFFSKYGTYGDEGNRHFLTEQAGNPDKHFLLRLIIIFDSWFIQNSTFMFANLFETTFLFGACKLVFLYCWFCNNGSVCIFGIGTDGDCPKKYFSLKATSYDPNLWESTYLGQLFVNSHIKQSHFSVQTRPNKQIHSCTVSFYQKVLNFLCN